MYVFPGGLPLRVIHIYVGLSPTRKKILKGISFRTEEIVGIDDLCHKGDVLSLNRSRLLQLVELLLDPFDDLDVRVQILASRVFVINLLNIAIS